MVSPRRGEESARVTGSRKSGWDGGTAAVRWVEVLNEPCELFSFADREGRPASAVRDRGCELSTLVVAGGFACGPLGSGDCDDEIIRPSHVFAVGSFTTGVPESS
jgi:hypothetical protein